jgi:hypothetical protein
MAAEKEVIIEFSKMAVEHSDSLLKISGALLIVNLLMIANLKGSTENPVYTRHASWLIFWSAAACLGSFVSGYLANSVITKHLGHYAASEKWEPADMAEYFTLGQMAFMFAAVVLFATTLWFYRRVAMDALRHTGIGGGGE